MAKMTATEAARAFSDVLNRVAAGEEIEISRGGAPVAILSPPRRYFVSPERFRELIESLPTVDDAFVADLEAIRKESGIPTSPWPS